MTKPSPTCPKCGKPMTMALPPGGKGLRSLQCMDCDRPDPLQSPDVTGWIKGLLGTDGEDAAPDPARPQE